VIEEKEGIWMTEDQVVLIVEMTEEVAVVQEVVEAEEIEEAAVAVQEAVADKVEEVADLVVVEEAVALVEPVAVVVEEDNVVIRAKILNKKLVTRNFIKCYNRKERNTGKCRKAV
jgi:hypothetical protein